MGFVSESTGDMQPKLLEGRYEVRSLIARGGMGSVFKAWDIRLHRSVAVKVMNPELTEDESARVDREIAIASHTHHPGFAEVLDIGVVDTATDERRFMVMELVNGGSLQDSLVESAPDLKTVAEIGTQVADALGHLHLRGVLHLDVKPGNILIEHVPTLGFTRRARLIDFGIAQPIDGHGRAPGRSIVASAAYMSPEHVEGLPLGGASDVYSLGLVLLRCITGREEFTGTQADAAIERLRRDPEIPELLPTGWSQLLAAMTLRAPAGRPTAHDVAGEFDAFARASRHTPTTFTPTRSPLAAADDALSTAELAG